MVAEADFSDLYHVLENAPKLALAVSGGSDSTSLMWLCARWLSQQKEKGARCLHVLCVDHQLRHNSEQEAKAVCAQAENLGLSASILTWEHEATDSAIQQKARQARYALMGDWVRAHGFDGIVTAHTRDDQAETLLMRLARGSGMDGLAAMAAETRLAGVRVFRPFLNVSRTRLRQLLKTNNISWIDDPSNEDEKFERVRVRGLLDLLEEKGIGRKSLALAAHRAGRASRALDEASNRFLKRHVTVFPEGFCRVALAAYCQLNDEIGIRVMARLLDWAGGGQDYAQLGKIERLYEVVRADCQSGVVGGQKGHTLAGAQLVVGQKDLVFGREFGRMEKTLQKQVTRWDGRFVFDQPVDVLPYGVIMEKEPRKRPPELPHFVMCSLPAIRLSREQRDLASDDAIYQVPHIDGPGAAGWVRDLIHPSSWPVSK